MRTILLLSAFLTASSSMAFASEQPVVTDKPLTSTCSTNVLAYAAKKMAKSNLTSVRLAMVYKGSEIWVMTAEPSYSTTTSYALGTLVVAAKAGSCTLIAPSDAAMAALDKLSE